MRLFIFLTVLTILVAPISASAEESRSAGLYERAKKKPTATIPPEAVSTSPRSRATFTGRSVVDKSQAGITVTNAPARTTSRSASPTKIGETVRRSSGFKSSPEIDDASRASVLSGKRLDARIYPQADSVPRIQELGF